MGASGNSLEGKGPAGGASDAGQAFEPADFDGLEGGCLVRDACDGGWPFERIASCGSEGEGWRLWIDGLCPMSSA